MTTDGNAGDKLQALKAKQAEHEAEALARKSKTLELMFPKPGRKQRRAEPSTRKQVTSEWSK